MKRVATPSMPTQRPPHSAEAPAAGQDAVAAAARPAAGAAALSLSTSQARSPSRPRSPRSNPSSSSSSSSRDRPGPARSRRSGRRPPRRWRRPRSRCRASSSSKSLAASSCIGPVVGVAVGVEGVDLEVGVVEDVLLALAGSAGRCVAGGGWVFAQRRLGLGREGGDGLMFAPLKGASSIESAPPRPRPEAIWRLIPESLGRDRLIPEKPGSAAVTSESLGSASGVASNSSLASSSALSSKSLPLSGWSASIDARRGQLEVAVALDRRRRPATSADEPDRSGSAGPPCRPAGPR